MTKLLINKLKQDLIDEPSAASEQGKKVMGKFNILDKQLGPNLEAMTNFFGNIHGIDKFDLDSLNPFKREGFDGQGAHPHGPPHLLYKSIDGRLMVNKETAYDTQQGRDEYKLYKQLDFQTIHTNSQASWGFLWGFILLVLIIIKAYFFVSAFLFKDSSQTSEPHGAQAPDLQDLGSSDEE